MHVSSYTLHMCNMHQPHCHLQNNVRQCVNSILTTVAGVVVLEVGGYLSVELLSQLGYYTLFQQVTFGVHAVDLG